MKKQDLQECNPAPLADRMLQVPELDGKKMTIAVYNFLDKTGQRKSCR